MQWREIWIVWSNFTSLWLLEVWLLFTLCWHTLEIEIALLRTKNLKTEKSWQVSRLIQIYQRKTNICLLNTCNVWWRCQRVPYLFAPRTCWLFQIFLRIMIRLVVFSVCNSEISVLGDFPSHYIIVYHFLVSSLLCLF